MSVVQHRPPRTVTPRTVTPHRATTRSVDHGCIHAILGMAPFASNQRPVARGCMHEERAMRLPPRSRAKCSRSRSYLVINSNHLAYIGRIVTLVCSVAIGTLDARQNSCQLPRVTEDRGPTGRWVGRRRTTSFRYVWSATRHVCAMVVSSSRPCGLPCGDGCLPFGDGCLPCASDAVCAPVANRTTPDTRW